MPNLGDYLGQLLSEITVARMHADLEAIRIAELYAAHPLLKSFPIPRLRLPDIEVELPVLIKGSEEPAPGLSARGGAGSREIRAKFDELLAAHVAQAAVPLSQQQQDRIRESLDSYERLRKRPSETAVDVVRTGDDMVNTVLGAIEGADRSAVSKLSVSLRESVRLEFLKLREPPPRVLALVTTAELREGGPSENFTRLRLKITEEGVEWTSIDSDSGSHERLVRE